VNAGSWSFTWHIVTSPCSLRQQQQGSGLGRYLTDASQSTGSLSATSGTRGSLATHGSLATGSFSAATEAPHHAASASTAAAAALLLAA
jgi:hypothetical protein